MLEVLFPRRQDEELKQSIALSFERVRQDNNAIFQWLGQLWQHAVRQERAVAELKSRVPHVPSVAEVAHTVECAIEKRFDFASMAARVKLLESAAQELADLRQDVGDVRATVGTLRSEVAQLRALSEHPSTDGELRSMKADLNATRLSQSAMRDDASALRRRVDALASIQQPILDRLAAVASPTPSEPPSSPSSQHPSFPVPRVAPPPRHRLAERVYRSVARHSKSYVKGVILDAVAKHGRMGGLQLRDLIVDEQGLASKSAFYRLLEELGKEGRLSVVHDGKEKVYLAVDSAKSVVRT